MENYINYLLKDFKDSAFSVEGLMDGRRHASCIDELMIEVEASRYILLKEYVNIQPEQLPPVERLTSTQILKLEKGLIALYEAYGFLFEYPPSASCETKYQVLVDVLDKEVPILVQFLWHLPSCDFEPFDCPFGLSVCTCLYE